MNKVEKENIGSLIEVFKSAVSYFKNRSSIGLRTPRRSVGLTPLRMDYSPNPYSGRVVKTVSESLEDIMMREGRMSREVWEQLRGLEYDGHSFDDDDVLADREEHYDEFEQSSLASYYDFKEARAKRSQEQQVVTAARQSDSNVTTPATNEAVVKGDSDVEQSND
ncbi:MAG: hypothetical protein [Microviridae sp.]|nr:MAG: hypothetical protein [Microviridae sp.]